MDPLRHLASTAVMHARQSLHLPLLVALALAGSLEARASDDWCPEMYPHAPAERASCEAERRAAVQKDEDAADAAFLHQPDTGEPCAKLRANNEGATMATMQPLPARCVPAGKRAAHVYQRVPKGLTCLPGFFLDRQGAAGSICGPTIDIFNADVHGRACNPNLGDLGHAWMRSACHGAGTGTLFCDDGTLAVMTSNGPDECTVTVRKHVPPLVVPY